MFIDKVIINIKSGDGGSGAISFNQDSKNSRGGPDGGNGGRGGSVWIRCDKNMSNLNSYRFSKNFKAENGGKGADQNKTGFNGKDVYINVPVGTLIRDKSTKRNLLANLSCDEDSFEVLTGGKGGRGNVAFVTSKNKEPLLAESGEKIDIEQIELDFRVSSNLCLIGPPNSGKSTLINNISNAKPDIGNYPFTTREPVIATVQRKFQNVTVIEIPGLVKDPENNLASGNQYLKHLKKTNIIGMVIDINSDILSEINLIYDELKKYNKALLEKKIVLILTHCDELEEADLNDFINEITQKFRSLNDQIFTLNNSLDDKIMKFIDKIQEYLLVIDNEDMDDDVPIIKFHKNELKRVMFKDDHFVINDKHFIQLAEGSNLNNWKTLVQFQYKLKSSKIGDELINIGIKRGDLLKIGQYAFTWEE